MRNQFWLRASIVLAGCVIILTISLGLGLPTECGDKLKLGCAWGGRIDYWLNRYQTLISGLLALFAALIGVYYLRRQIEQNEIQETNRIKRKEDASKAVLPVALNGLSKYAESCIEVLKQLDSWRTIGCSSLTHYQMPSIPQEAISVVKDVAESTDSCEMRRLLADNIAVIQIQHSRLEKDLIKVNKELSFSPSADCNIVEDAIVNYMCDALEVYANQSRLYPYARGERDQPTKPHDFHNAATSLGVFEETHPKVFQKLKIRKLISERIKEPLE